MCGIAGWVIKDTEAPLDGTLAAMLEAIVHRGPDDQGTYQHRSQEQRHEVSLGHRRLAIIDPQGAQQPMCDTDAGIALVFNGEIYNFRELRTQLSGRGYRFTRDSDTEVLLRAYQEWGSDAVRHLRGMFAFAIWDSPKARLVLARDRFGEKPLFVYEKGRSLFFASEIKALLKVPEISSEVDVEAVWDYLAYRYVPAPATLFRGIRKVMPGTVAIWERGALVATRFWQPPDGQLPSPEERHEDPVAEFWSQLSASVERQMVSDVAFGAFLSGGLDSSTIVGLMSRYNSKVQTFSVGFDEGAYSELAYAREIATLFETDHHELVVCDQDIMEWLPALVAHRDAPVAEPSDVAIHLLAREASRSVKMVLSGEGSDEVLGGYPKHVAERFAACFQKVPAPMRLGLLQPLVQALPYRYRRAKTAVANLNIEDWHERQARWFGALNRSEREALSVLRPAADAQRSGPPFDANPASSLLRRILYFDQTSWLPDNLLERADRMTMAASIEARVPFLDHELAAFVSSLPDHYRVRGLTGKWILREAAKQIIPATVLSRPKVGFRVPVNEWFRGPLRDYVRDHLQSASSTTRAYFDAATLDRILSEHFAGRHNHEKLVWTLLNLEIWHRLYV